jgi:aryl-alcohol dehydrogenase-like predicted oxidoreductase
MNGLPRIATIQNLYNLTARSFETSLLTETCYREEVSLLAYSPLAFGQLSAKYLDNPKAPGRLTIFPANWSPRYLGPSVLAAVKEYAQMALACSRWFVGSTIIGATALAQLKENIDAFDLGLRPDVIEAIDAIHARNTNPGA